MYNEEHEVWEAIKAGQRSLQSLKAAERQLNSAKNWGIVDIIGGNTIAGMFKHMKINNAQQYIDDAKRDLMDFRTELLDIRTVEDMPIDINGFFSFADFFFDGFLADVFVQSKIKQGQRQVQDAIWYVNFILNALQNEY